MRSIICTMLSIPIIEPLRCIYCRYRFLRSLDRDMNKECYPRLKFPEIYLLEGGYKAFYQTNKTFCEPQDYVPMLHENHGKELRHFRVMAPATRGLRNWWLPSPLWHMGGKSPQKQRRPIIIEQN